MDLYRVQRLEKWWHYCSICSVFSRFGTIQNRFHPSEMRKKESTCDAAAGVVIVTLAITVSDWIRFCVLSLQSKPALPALERLIHSNDEEVLTDACWALSYLSDGTNDKIQAVIEAGVCRRLVELLL